MKNIDKIVVSEQPPISKGVMWLNSITKKLYTHDEEGWSSTVKIKPYLNIEKVLSSVLPGESLDAAYLTDTSIFATNIKCDLYDSVYVYTTTILVSGNILKIIVGSYLQLKNAFNILLVLSITDNDTPVELHLWGEFMGLFTIKLQDILNFGNILKITPCFPDITYIDGSIIKGLGPIKHESATTSSAKGWFGMYKKNSIDEGVALVRVYKMEELYMAVFADVKYLNHSLFKKLDDGFEKLDFMEAFQTLYSMKIEDMEHLHFYVGLSDAETGDIVFNLMLDDTPKLTRFHVEGYGYEGDISDIDLMVTLYIGVDDDINDVISNIRIEIDPVGTLYSLDWESDERGTIFLSGDSPVTYNIYIYRV